MSPMYLKSRTIAQLKDLLQIFKDNEIAAKEIKDELKSRVKK